jgi:putative hemolysin
MSGITGELFLILLLILANGVFAMSEIAVVSARRSRLQQQAEAGSNGAAAALALTEEPTRFLSTVQVGITLIGILTGAFGGAAIAAPLATVLAQVPLIAPYSGVAAFMIVVVAITYLSLIVGELVPKRIALTAPERVASMIARPMTLLSRITYPLVTLLSASTDLLLKLLRVKAPAEPPVTEEEITALIEQGTAAGIFEEAEQDLVDRVFRLGDLRVSSIMTPRRRLVWLDLSAPLETNKEKILDTTYSRLLVCQGELDNLVGMLKVRALLDPLWRNEPVELASALDQPLLVPESMRVLTVLERFKQSGIHLALVIDEYGSIQGLVTLNDVMGVVVGELPEADSLTDRAIVQREDGSWLLDGLLPVERVKELFDLEELPYEDGGSYYTLGGFIVTRLGRVPTVADHFQWGELRFEVVDMDGHRVDKVLIETVDASHNDLRTEGTR